MSSVPENDKPKPPEDGQPDQLAPFAELPELPAEEPEERRAFPRRRKMLRVLVSESLSNAEPFPGWVVDRSLGGMCLSVDRPIDEGAYLKVKPTSAPPSSPWVELRVQSARPKDESWDLGCAFVRTPTWEVLLQFG